MDYANLQRKCFGFFAGVLRMLQNRPMLCFGSREDTENNAAVHKSRTPPLQEASLGKNQAVSAPFWICLSGAGQANGSRLCLRGLLCAQLQCNYNSDNCNADQVGHSARNDQQQATADGHQTLDDVHFLEEVTAQAGGNAVHADNGGDDDQDDVSNLRFNEQHGRAVGEYERNDERRLLISS